MQSSFSELEYAGKKKVTRRDRFLAEIEAVTPWTKLVAALEPFYPKGEGRGRPPIGLVRMLRMYIVQQCFGLSDEGMGDAGYDSQAIRRFIGIDLNVDTAPDATTLLKYRRLLETTVSPRSYSTPSTATLPQRACCSRKARLWTPPSLLRRLPRRTRRANVIRTCTRQRRETNGTSA